MTPAQQRAVAAGVRRARTGLTDFHVWSDGAHTAATAEDGRGAQWYPREDPDNGRPAPDLDAALTAYCDQVGAPAAPVEAVRVEFVREEPASPADPKPCRLCVGWRATSERLGVKLQAAEARAEAVEAAARAVLAHGRPIYWSDMTRAPGLTVKGAQVDALRDALAALDGTP